MDPLKVKAEGLTVVQGTNIIEQIQSIDRILASHIAKNRTRNQAHNNAVTRLRAVERELAAYKQLFLEGKLAIATTHEADPDTIEVG